MLPWTFPSSWFTWIVGGTTAGAMRTAPQFGQFMIHIRTDMVTIVTTAGQSSIALLALASISLGQALQASAYNIRLWGC